MNGRTKRQDKRAQSLILQTEVQRGHALDRRHNDRKLQATITDTGDIRVHRLLLASIIYLPALLMLMVAERAWPTIAGPLPVGSPRYRKSDRLPAGTASPQLSTCSVPDLALHEQQAFPFQPLLTGVCPEEKLR